jgi:MFS family permease
VGLLATWRANFAPLATPAVRLYLGGSAVSMLGNWLQQTAQALLVYQLSGGSAAAVGMTSFCSGIPLLLLSPFSGALADRIDRRRLLIGCHALEMLLAGCLALLAQSGAARLGHVYAIASMMGAINSVHFPAQQAMFFDLAGMAHIRKLVSLNSVVLNICRTGGPALAGWLVARHGPALAFWQNALSFLAVIAVLLRLRGLQGHGLGAASGAGLPEALRHLRAEVQLRYAYLSCAILTMFGLATLTLAPALARGDPRQTGLILGAAGAGSLVYALFLSPFLNNLPRMGLALSLALSWMGCWQLFAAWTPAPGLRLVGMFNFGLATSMAMVGSTGMIQVLAPARMRGRLMGMFSMIGFGAQPLAALLGGMLADRIGARQALALAGIAAIACALALLRKREWREGSMPDAAAAGMSKAVQAP